MVVLEDCGIMNANPNKYLQPDYLSPLPSTMDSKKSPLALLAQTCSQIGADTTPTKPLLSTMDKKKQVNSVNSDNMNRSSPNINNKTDKPRSTPENKHLAFKPYETNVLTKKPEESRPSSKASSDSCDDKKSGKSTPGRKSTPPSTENGKNSPSNDRKSSSAGSSGTSPIIRSGLEVLGHGKDHFGAFKNIQGMPGFNPLAGLYCPPGMEQHTNPAFRPPFAGAPFSTHHHAAMLAAAVNFPGSSPNPYLGYARVKTPAGGETVVPVCKDPYCTGCQFSVNNHHLLMSNGSCPAGCTQCEHQKYNLAMAMALSQQGAAAGTLSYPQLSRGLICNWVGGETYCGKRFGNGDELLQHLRSHTTDSAIASSASSTQQSLLSPYPNPLFTTAGLRSAYSTAPLSPLAANRYSPYSKSSLPVNLGPSPYGAFNPALGPFYSPYAMYGQRLGAAAVHQ